MSDLTNRFRSLSETLCQALELEGLIVRPYQMPSLPYFQALTSTEKEQVLQLLENYTTVCRAVRAGGTSIRDAHESVNKALKHFNLQVDAQVFDYIDPMCVFEFYSTNQTQFFRTANFFEFNSYTIEDIYSRNWMSLYDRDEEITREIFEFATKILSGETKDVIRKTWPAHIVTERASLEKLKTEVRFECLAPLTRDGQTVGILSIVRCTDYFMD